MLHIISSGGFFFKRNNRSKKQNQKYDMREQFKKQMRISELLQVNYNINFLSPTLFGLLWVFLLVFLLFSRSILYLISTVQVFHGTLWNLIWLSSIKIHGIFSLLLLLFAPHQSPVGLFCGTMPWLLGPDSSEKSIPSTWPTVWGGSHKLLWWTFTGKPLIIKAGSWERWV